MSNASALDEVALMSSSPLKSNIGHRSVPSKVTTSPAVDGISATKALDATRDARHLVRLAQCPQCSYPLQEPVTLPCGNAICKKCIPKSHLRMYISYPATANRLQGFTCPFAICQEEHAIGDCSVDVVLNKVLSVVREEIEMYRNMPEASEILMEVAEQDEWTIAGVSRIRDEEPRTRVLPGGSFVATYTMAEMGELGYDSEATYYPVLSSTEQASVLDTAVLEHLKEATRSELDCQVCYGLFLDPYTTQCGHTFCRKCLHQVRNHSKLCPVCRRVLSIPGGGADKNPSNILINKLLTDLCAEALAARIEASKIDELNTTAELDTPLFVCTISFPEIPTFLHIFEAKYRRMIRRVMESGDRKFGMLLHNPSRQPQGELGPVPFYQYGTLLHIINVHMMHDGRSLIETRGASRFRVLKYGIRDEYTVGKVERVDDISISAEEALEVSETSNSANTHSFPAADHFGVPPHHTSSSVRRPPLTPQDLNRMPTQGLMDIGTAFIKKMRDKSAPWLHAQVFEAYGECPEDPALFPWWFASVLPIGDDEKYKLLATSSVRERLKTCAGWISQLEAHRWGQSSNCNVI